MRRRKHTAAAPTKHEVALDGWYARQLAEIEARDVSWAHRDRLTVWAGRVFMSGRLRLLAQKKKEQSHG